MELQADCYAGMWAHHANRRHQVLESGDVDRCDTFADAGLTRGGWGRSSRADPVASS